MYDACGIYASAYDGKSGKTKNGYGKPLPSGSVSYGGKFEPVSLVFSRIDCAKVSDKNLHRPSRSAGAPSICNATPSSSWGSSKPKPQPIITPKPTPMPIDKIEPPSWGSPPKIPVPEPIITPKPTPMPIDKIPEPIITPDPTPGPTPEPTPEPTPDPTYEPTSDPTPEPTPNPTPVPTPPEEIPVVTPSPTPMPTEGSTPTVSDEATGPPTKQGRDPVRS